MHMMTLLDQEFFLLHYSFALWKVISRNKLKEGCVKLFSPNKLKDGCLKCKHHLKFEVMTYCTLWFLVDICAFASYNDRWHTIKPPQIARNDMRWYKCYLWDCMWKVIYEMAQKYFVISDFLVTSAG